MMESHPRVNAKPGLQILNAAAKTVSTNYSLIVINELPFRLRDNPSHCRLRLMETAIQGYACQKPASH
jgi:hypothetical protein